MIDDDHNDDHDIDDAQKDDDNDNDANYDDNDMIVILIITWKRDLLISRQRNEAI